MLLVLSILNNSRQNTEGIEVENLIYSVFPFCYTKLSHMMNYVDVDFIQKELKDKISVSDDSHYAEVVVQHKAAPMNKAVISPPTPTQNDSDVIYRLNSDYKIEKVKIQAKKGDLFLSKEKDKGGNYVGVLLQMSPKNNYHTNVSIPTDKLISYIPVKKPPTPLSPTTTNDVYVDMSDIKCVSGEMETLSGFFSEFSNKSPPPQPATPAPTKEKSKIVPKQKLAKLKSESQQGTDEIAIFAILDRKSSSKEKEVLTFKQKQLGVLIFSSNNGWWLIRMVDGSTSVTGWVPRDYWRFMPENMDDDYSNCDYSPWLFTNDEISYLEDKLQTNGEERNFLFMYDKREEAYFLLVKCHSVVHKFIVNILPDRRLIFSGRYFQSIDNLVLYFKRVSFCLSGSECTLGAPFTKLIID